MKMSKIIGMCYFFIVNVRASGYSAQTQDQTSPRANTLFDDPDDLQKQLDNEARDKAKIGKPKTIWVFHIPSSFPRNVTDGRIITKIREANLLERRTRSNVTAKEITSYDNKSYYWDYKDQSKWGTYYPDCRGFSQSPVDIPYKGLIKIKTARNLRFNNHDTVPKNLVVMNDGRSVRLFGEWDHLKRPSICDGAAYSRCYLFYSISLHWPSEHTIGGLMYPVETQSLYVSSLYDNFESAVNASTNDPLAFLGVANFYKFSEKSHKGLEMIVETALKAVFDNKSLPLHPLKDWNPPFKEYVAYHGSLTSPPCTEAVLWFVRARSLPVTRKLVDDLQNMSVNGETVRTNHRETQKSNDRRFFLQI